MKDYYDKRAPEYDATTYQLARSNERSQAHLRELKTMVRNLDRQRTLDIGCGTGWLRA